VLSAEHQLRADRANILVIQHSMEAAAAEVERAEEDLSYTTVTSPIDGVITKIETEVGELAVVGVLNQAGTTLMEVADLSKMILVARVDETSIARVKVGQKAKARVQAYPDTVFDGVVESVALARTTSGGGRSSSSVSMVQGTYFETKILLDTKGKRILSGLNADVDIETQRHDDVLTVPSQAVLGRATDDLPPAVRSRPEVDPNKTIVTVVYRVENNKAVVTPVKVGPSDVNSTVILSGLKAGDQVIVGPYKVLESLTEGQAVKIDTLGASTQPATQASTQPGTQPATTQTAQ
jgi:HlyD family secretion protein